MAYQLEFDRYFRYPDAPLGVAVPVALQVNGLAVELIAKIDTGAQYCVFERVYGEELDLEIEAGHPLHLETADRRRFRVFGHELIIECLGAAFLSTVYFAESPQFIRNVLGRNGWLNKCRIALVDHDQQLYFSPHG